MLSRPSTMFKSLKVVAVLLAVVIGIVHGQILVFNETSTSSPNDSGNNDSNRPTEASTDMSTTDSSSESSFSLFDGRLLENILDGLIASPVGIIFRPLSLILRPIFWMVDTILAPAFFIVRSIMSPFSWVMNLVNSIVGGVYDLLGNLGNSVSSIGPFISLVISNLSGILRANMKQGSGGTSVQQRQRRSIVDSMMGMTWTTLTYPFRFVYDIISTLLSPFYYFYNIVSWPLHFIFGGDADNDNSTSIATFSSYLPFSDMISALLLKLSDSSQDAIIELLKYAWARTKEYLLPAVDELSVWAQDSEYVPEDIKSGLSALHSAYSVLHMFGFL